MAVVSLRGLEGLAQVFPRNRRSLNSPMGGMARNAMHLARKQAPDRPDATLYIWAPSRRGMDSKADGHGAAMRWVTEQQASGFDSSRIRPLRCLKGPPPRHNPPCQ